MLGREHEPHDGLFKDGIVVNRYGDFCVVVVTVVVLKVVVVVISLAGRGFPIGNCAGSRTPG